MSFTPKTLKERVALDRTSWSIETVFYKKHMVEKNVLKVEYNDPHKLSSKLRGFLFTVRTNTAGNLWESKI